MTKKILTSIFCLAFALNTFAVTSYTITGSGSNLTLTITGTGDMPNYYNGGSPWYSQRANIKTVVINSGVTSIGNGAFSGCSSLTSVTIPNSVTSIGSGTFSGCINLTSITIPSSVTSIISSFSYLSCDTFDGCCSLSAINVDQANPNYSSLNGVLFNKNKTRLITYPIGKTEQSYSIPNSVTTISAHAFFPGGLYRCISSLVSVTVPESVTTIEEGAFNDGSGSNLTAINVNQSNPNYSSLDGVVFNKNKTTLVCYPPGKKESYTIPNSVTTIKQRAFSNTDLTSVTIPESVTTIGEYAFSSCDNLTNVTVNWAMPLSINSNVFYGTHYLYFLHTPVNSCALYAAAPVWQDFSNILCGQTSWQIGYPNAADVIATFNNSTGTLTVTGIGAMRDWGNYSLPVWFRIASLSNVVINSGVTTIGNYAFSYCSGLTSVTIPNSVTSIDNGAFTNCSDLTTVNFNAINCTMSSLVFDECPKFTTLNIGNDVTKIPNAAFARCHGLTSVTIPNSVTSIDNGAFANCQGLKELTIEDGNNMLILESDIFSSSPLEKVYLGRSMSYNSYHRSPFYNNTTIKELTIGNSVTSIGNYAFSDCSGLTTVNFNATNCTMGYLYFPIFNNCTNLTTVNIGSNVIQIPNQAFSGCSGLTSVTIPNSVTSIGEYAFSGCRGLTSVTIPNSVTSIGNSAFSSCSGLTSVTIPNSVTSIGNYAFFDCSGLTSVTIPNSVTLIGSYAFVYCTGLTDVTVNWATPLPIDKKVFVEEGFGGNIVLSNVNLNIPGNRHPLYAAADVWKEFNLVRNLVPQVIPFTSIPEKTYGDDAILLPQLTDVGEIITYQSSNTAVATVMSNILTIKGAGTAYIIATQNGNTWVLEATPVTQPITVTKAPLTVKAENKSRRINTPNPTLTYTISGFKNSETQSVIDVLPTISTTATQASGAGNYPITVSGASDNNYSFTYQNGTLTVNSLEPQTITFNALPAKTYGDAAFTLSASSSSGLPISFTSNNTAVATISGNTVTIVGAGEATITASQAGNTDYNSATTSKVLTVNKAPLTVTVDNKSREYGNVNPAFTYSISGFKNGETQSVLDVLPTITTIATQVSDVGNYAITVSGGAATNYNLSYQNGTLAVGKAMLSVVADNKSRRINTPNPALTYTILGFKNGETQSVIDVLPTISTTAIQASGAGSYPITVSGASDNNYDFTYQNGALTVNNLETQTIAFNALPAKTYGDSAFTLSASSSSGLPVSFTSNNPAVATVSGSIVTVVGAGETVITASQAGNTDYNSATSSGVLTVNKARLTITAENKTREYGEANPVFTLLYSGFKNAENESVLDYLPTVSCAATKTSPAGFYDIVLSGGSDNNYQYTLLNGVLQVINSTVGVTGVSLNKTAVALTIGKTEWLTATVVPANATNRDVTWTSTDNTVAAVVDGLIIALNAGTCSIIATTQDGNFMAFCNVTVTAFPNGIDEVSAVQLSVYPNPVREELFIKSDLPIKKVEIISLSGTLLLSESCFNEKISVAALSKGIYLLRVHTEKGVAVQKIVKE